MERKITLKMVYIVSGICLTTLEFRSSLLPVVPLTGRPAVLFSGAERSRRFERRTSGRGHQRCWSWFEVAAGGRQCHLDLLDWLGTVC